MNTTHPFCFSRTIRPMKWCAIWGETQQQQQQQRAQTDKQPFDPKLGRARLENAVYTVGYHTTSPSLRPECSIIYANSSLHLKTFREVSHVVGANVRASSHIIIRPCCRSWAKVHEALGESAAIATTTLAFASQTNLSEKAIPTALTTRHHHHQIKDTLFITQFLEIKSRTNRERTED